MDQTSEIRRSRRLRGLPFEYGICNPSEKFNNSNEMVTDMTDVNTQTVIAASCRQHIRNPSVFRGEPGQDPNKWLREYARVANYNNWDELFCLANVYFFLDGTARQWYENNEEVLSSWNLFKVELQKTFGDNQQSKRKAEEELKRRAQIQGESTQSYIQSVLGLCQEVNASMNEDEKVSHLMKGVAEDIYQTLLTKELRNSQDFIKWCRYIEDTKQKRIGGQKFDHLPNVVPIAAINEKSDLVGLIRQIVQEEVQRFAAPRTEDFDPRRQSIETLIREEVEDALTPITETRHQWTGVQSRRSPPNTMIRRRPRLAPEVQDRKTDLWRTEDNRPVCFHCGRPGHVVRYCRERRAIFDAHRTYRGNTAEQRLETNDVANGYSRTAATSASPSPSRGRSSTPRYRSPSPYRRSAASPNRRHEEN